MAECHSCHQHGDDDAMHCGHCGARMPARSLDKRTRFGFASSVPKRASVPKPASVPEQASVPKQASVPEAALLEQPSVPGQEPQESMLSTRIDDPPDLPVVTRNDQPAVDDQTTNNSVGSSNDVHQLVLHTPVSGHTQSKTEGTEPVVYTTEMPSGIPPTVEAKRQQQQLKIHPRSRGTVLRIGMLLGGLLLIALFSVPWGQRDSSLMFSWDLMGTLSGMDFILRIYLAAVGVVMLVAGALPFPTTVRGSIGVLLAGFPLATFMVAHANPSWIALTTSCVVIAAALLHGASHPSSVFARVVTCICFLGVLVAVVVPLDQGRPMLIQFFSGWTGNPLGVAAHVLTILMILLALLSIPVVFARLATPARIMAATLVLYAPAELFLRAMSGLQSAPFLDQVVPTYTSLSLLVYCPVGTLSLAALCQAFMPQRPTC
jgi:hypothetical protein